MRARLLSAVAVLAVLAGACGTVPSSAVAIVEGREISMARFERIVAAQSAQLGLQGRDAEVAGVAVETGLLDRVVLDADLTAELNPADGSQTRIVPAELPDLPAEVVDDLFANQPISDGLLEDVGISRDRYRDVFARIAGTEAAGLINSQFQPGFPLMAADQIPVVQTQVLSQLVQAEIQAFIVEEAGLEVDPAMIDQSREQLLGQLPPDLTLEEILEGSGYDERDFEELFVTAPVHRDIISMATEQADVIGPLFENLDVNVARRFGRWDTANGQLVPATRG